MDKTQLDNCIKWLRGSGMRQFIRNFLKQKVPDYFWEIPASSTGKYHPDFASGKGGLVRHTRVAVDIAISLLDENIAGMPVFSAQDRDIILAALIVHDTFKKGIPEEEYSRADHGVICADMIEKSELPDKIKFKLAGAVAAHMGYFNKDYKTKKVIAPEPQNELESFVHLCDYLSSRKPMNIDFDEIKT